MKDDANCMTTPRTQTADTVSKIDAISAARAAHRTIVHGKGYGVPLTEGNNFRPRLHARPLLGKYKFSACKILRRVG
jgi:hypothetical protein